MTISDSVIYYFFKDG